MFKLITILLILINISLLSYDFSEILPRDTIFYFTIKDFDSFTNKFNKTKISKLYKAKDIESIKKVFKKIISMSIYKEDEDISKIEILSKNFSKFIYHPFAFTIGLDNFFKPEYSLLIQGKNLDKDFEFIYKEVFKKELKTGKAIVKKEIIKNIKVNILEVKYVDKYKKIDPFKFNKNSKDNVRRFVYGVIDDKLIITSSKSYMKTLISSIKNKNIPKLKNNLIFKKDSIKYKDSELYMFTDLKTLIKLSSADKEVKKTINHYSLNKLESMISYLKFENNSYDIFFKLTSLNTLPSIIKDVIFKNTTISVPEFIPDTCYSFNAISINFPELYNTLTKYQTQKERKKMLDMESRIGLNIKSISSTIGKTIYILSFFKNDKANTLLLFTFNKPKILLNLIKNIGSSPIVGITESDYLDGKVFTASGSFNTIGLAIGYKNNNFIFGEIKLVKEMIQRMSGGNGSFYNSNFYKKLIKVMNKKQSVISFTDLPISLNSNLKKINKEFKKDYKKASNKSEMKELKLTKRIINLLSEINIKELRKYFNYLNVSIYTIKNELILEFKEVK